MMYANSTIIRMRNVKLLAAVCVIIGFLCTFQEWKLSSTIQRGLAMSDSGYNPDKVALCIITAAYGNDENSVDIPLDAREYAHEDVRFFYFTNSEASQIRTPGWTKIIKDLPQYKNRIVQSRWPKFQGFKHPEIEKKCRTIMYMDASSSIQATMDELVALGIIVRVSEQGFAQTKHLKKRASITEEFKVILNGKKDRIENVQASIDWMTQQKDWKDDVTIYQNNHFCYDHHKAHVIEMMDFFWNRYSMEMDSWRDQPLWAYTVHHFQFTPIILQRHMIGYDISRMHNGHKGAAEEESSDAPKLLIIEKNR